MVWCGVARCDTQVRCEMCGMWSPNIGILPGVPLVTAAGKRNESRGRELGGAGNGEKSIKRKR